MKRPPIACRARRCAVLALALLVGSGAVSTRAPSQSAPPAPPRRVVVDTFFNTLWRGHRILARIRPGEAIVTTTVDAYGRDERGVQRARSGNPVTGPFYVEGAEPGDALLVHLHRLRLTRGWGATPYRLALVALTPEAIETVYPDTFRADAVVPGRVNRVAWDIDTTRMVVRLREPKSARLAMEFPVSPMLGVIGVAPPGDFAPTSGPSAGYGGNLDFNEIREGTVVHLPVYHPGALLFLADGHALQADGEPTGGGIEVPLEVTFSVELRKGARLTGPRVETATHIVAIGSQAEFQSALDRAVQMATSDMVRWLVDGYGVEPWAAHLLIGYQGEYEIVTVAGSAALKMAKRLLPVPTVVPQR